MAEADIQSDDAEKKAQSGDLDNQSDDQDSNSSDDNLDAEVTVEELEKRLLQTSLEAKKFRQANAQLKAKLKEIEDKKLEEQGKYKEMYEKTLKEHEELKGKLVSASKSNAFRKEAAAQGCVPELIEALEKLADLDEVELEDGIKPNQDQIKFTVKSLRDQYGAHFFKKEPPKIREGGPKPQDGKGLTYDAWLELPLDEKKKRMSEVLKDDK